MSSTTLEVVFEGPTVESGRIDAQLLAESLAGYSEVFRRANFLVNGQNSEAAVLVHSDFRSGSFITLLDFVQNFKDQLLNTQQFFDSGDLAVVLGFLAQHGDAVKESLIAVYKWLKGKKPENAVQVGNEIEITFGSNKKKVSNITYNLYGDATIKAALGKLTAPLREAPIERISIRQNGAEQTAIEKSEAEYFDSESLALESADEDTRGTRQTNLIISKLSFVERTAWTFIERGATLSARIEHKEFWAQVHKRSVTFGEGDRLRVELRWTVIRSRTGKLVARNVITKVFEVIPSPKQQSLYEEVPPRQRRIRLK